METISSPQDIEKLVADSESSSRAPSNDIKKSKHIHAVTDKLLYSFIIKLIEKILCTGKSQHFNCICIDNLSIYRIKRHVKMN